MDPSTGIGLIDEMRQRFILHDDDDAGASFARNECVPIRWSVRFVDGDLRFCAAFASARATQNSVFIARIQQT